MNQQSLTSRSLVTLVLILQFLPLVLFPPDLLAAFDSSVWFGIGLALMALVAVVVVLGWRTREAWPWYLLAFCHGFNIISRLLMMWPNVGSASQGADALYLILTAVAIVLSGLFLWYNELPDVRTRLAKDTGA